MRTMNVRNARAGDRTHLTVYLDNARMARLHDTTSAYEKAIGRPASLSLLMQRALDLLEAHVSTLTTPSATFTEKITIVGPARHSIKET